MKTPLKNLVYEKIKQHKNIFDTELLTELDDGVSMKQLNKVLFHLEILGLLTVRWVGKEKRRIELVEKEPEEA